MLRRGLSTLYLPEFIYNYVCSFFCSRYPETATPYSYSPLGCGQIRLLMLHPGAFNDDINISLCTHDFQSIEAKEPYEAVSYVWGSTEFTKSIRIDEDQLDVTENVETLLRHLRLPHASRRLWIDGICINQKDKKERSNQVLMMKKIFSAPSRVLIWVGPEDEDTILAIKQFWVWRARYRNGTDGWIYENDSDQDIKAVQRFTSRQWFHRVWTFQEACLPADADIICGRQRLPWKCVLEVGQNLMSRSMLQKAFGNAADSMIALVSFSPLIEGNERRTPELLDLLRLGRNREATDPRDKVFGTLGLLPDADDQAPISPDYDMDTCKVYIQCAQIILESSRDLRLLTSCLDPRKSPSLPSWVPDWRVKRSAAVLRDFGWGVDQIEIYHLNRASTIDSSPASVVLGNALHQRGAYLGTVTSTHSPEAFLKTLKECPWPRCDRDKLHERWNYCTPEFRKLLHSLSMVEQYHQTGESSQMALLRTLSANRLPEAKAMHDFVLKAAETALQQVLLLLGSIHDNIIEQQNDPKQLSIIESIVEQIKKDDQPVDYGSIMAFANEHVERMCIPDPQIRHKIWIPVGKYEDQIPPEWVPTLLAMYPRQKVPVREAAESSGKDTEMQDFVAVCDMAWSILNCKMFWFGGGSGVVVPARQELFHNSESAIIIDKMSSNIETFSSSRVVFKTDNGLIGLGADYMSEGDEVWDLVGGDVPFLLRQETSDSDHGDRRRYRLVGECYVHGIMSGELWEDESNQSATSSLRGKDLKFETIQIV